MIEIVVVSRQGVAPDQLISARFGPEGGSIGRAETNTLVLSDPDRTVSRLHAQVLHFDGQYRIVDRGSNPMQCNGRLLGAGVEAVLQGGDRLVVGSFELVVNWVGSPGRAPSAMPAGETHASLTATPIASEDPFADLLAGLAPAPPERAAPAPSASVAPVLPAALDDPLARPAAATPQPQDPFADLLAGGPASGPDPLGCDDFSDLGLPAAAQPVAHAQRIDDLFGGMPGGIGGDPLALSPLADPLLQPNTASREDPLAALGQLPPSSRAAQSDHLPIAQFGFIPPKGGEASQAQASPVAPPRGAAAVRFEAQTGEPIRISRAPSPRPSLAPSAADSGAGLSAALATNHADAAAAADPFAHLLDGLGHSASSADSHVALNVSGEVVEPAPYPAALTPDGNASWRSASLATSEPASPLAPPRSQGAQPPPPSSGADQLATGAARGEVDELLLAAFLRGLGPVHQAPDALTPALMERIGRLLRSATEGTLQLLLARQELKREVRAEVTMIGAQANNPLKFSPTAEVALTHLLGPGMRGFMSAELAMRDAYDDLRAHQFGVMVGMRAALETLIARFAPEELEKKIAARSAIDSLFAANRKAKLWDQFNALYQMIASEAEDDFHALFGRAFLQAYEEQMARLKREDGPSAGT